ncbi:uncharacterized protein LOC108669122 [Hyalella azteca]|uniref:Uncharacterized protein LOC108669122 n=1 Tax=Hyalella azteca TaxID=294128 RepID=A0A8B7NEK9_HYAAZ|nr:uncharacterized protein LOC108669122 [Hyalella azteca]
MGFYVDDGLGPSSSPEEARRVLATINFMYDPPGVVCPVVLTGRLVQRKLLPRISDDITHFRELGWDDELPRSVKAEWESWKMDLKEPESIEIPRCFISKNLGVPISSPRLELSAAAEAASSSAKIVAELECKVSTVHHYSDCKVVLGYTQNETRRNSRYVTGRAEVIRTDTPSRSFHVLNPQQKAATIETSTPLWQISKDPNDPVPISP